MDLKAPVFKSSALFIGTTQCLRGRQALSEMKGDRRAREKLVFRIITTC